MPISVKCPSCSSEFKVKDEYAGKRAKCPKCAEPLTIPAAAGPTDTVKMPAPLAPARPVVASKPKPPPVPVDDEDVPKPKRRLNMDDDEEPVSPKRKRGADSEDEEEKPKARKRGADSDEDDDNPKARKRGDDSDDDETPKGKRRRRDDDDAPKKKSKALPIILGIVGGLLLMCGGGCAGVYFFVLKPANDSLQAYGSSRMSMFDPPKTELPKDPGQGTPTGGNKVTKDNMNSLRAGMSLAQIEQLLGKGKSADDSDLFRGVNGTAADQQWKAKKQAGAVYAWGGVQDVILVAFTAPPASGGTLVGVRAAFGIETLEPVKLPGGGGTPTGAGKPVTPGNMALVNLGMTYAQVEAIFGPGKFAEDADMARLANGAASNANWTAKKSEGSVVVWGDQTNTIQVAFTAPTGGTVVGVRGLFGKDIAEPIPPPAAAVVITAANLVKEWDANPAAAEAKYKDKLLKVTGVVAEIPKEAVSFSLQGANPPTTKAAIAMPVNVPFGGWGPIKKMKVGDTVTVTCKFDSFAKNKNNVWELKLKDAVFVPK